MPPTSSDAARAAKIAANDDGGGPTSTRVPLTPSGFKARLEGLSLFDLVQMECLANTEKIIRIASQGRAGYLFFRSGQVVHAATRQATGEAAAFEILGWTDGTFEPCHIAWPERLTVTRPWQSLLLVAAKARDDQAAGKLVHLPSRAPDEPPAEEPEEIVKPSSSKRPPPSYQRAVRVDASGAVLSRAGDADELAGFASYSARLAEIVGRSLGFDRFLSLELELEASRCIVYVEETGNLVAVQAKSGVDLGSIARRAGL